MLLLLSTPRPGRTTLAILAGRYAASLPETGNDGLVTIACLGDSNTAHFVDTPDTWCELLAAGAAGVRAVNVAAPGSGATPGLAYHPGAVAADDQYTLALSSDPDVMLLAFVTNDLQYGGTPRRTVHALAALVRRFEQSRPATAEHPGRRAYVLAAPRAQTTAAAATCPSSLAARRAFNARVRRTNRLLQRALGDRFVPEPPLDQARDFRDCAHLDESGHRRRAASVARHLARHASDTP